MNVCTLFRKWHNCFFDTKFLEGQIFEGTNFWRNIFFLTQISINFKIFRNFRNFQNNSICVKRRFFGPTKNLCQKKSHRFRKLHAKDFQINLHNSPHRDDFVAHAKHHIERASWNAIKHRNLQRHLHSNCLQCCLRWHIALFAFTVLDEVANFWALLHCITKQNCIARGLKSVSKWFKWFLISKFRYNSIDCSIKAESNDLKYVCKLKKFLKFK